MQRHLEDRSSATAAAPSRRLRIVPPAEEPAPSSRRYGIAVAAVLGIAFVVRAAFVLGSDFPLNDGGMFLQMTRDLQGSGYALPAYTSYNGGAVPFAYPPLGFYLAAIIDAVTPLSLAGVFRFLPLIASFAAVAAFLFMARTLLPTRTHVITALVAFATLPATFQWMLMGGGVTRAPGFVFALLAVTFAYRAFERGSRRDAESACADQPEHQARRQHPRQCHLPQAATLLSIHVHPPSHSGGVSEACTEKVTGAEGGMARPAPSPEPILNAIMGTRAELVLSDS